MSRANNYGVGSNMPGNDPVKRVDILDIEELIGDGPVKICRCYKSKKFPFCDGAHVSHNKETGDNTGPVVLKCGLPAECSNLEAKADIDDAELSKQVTGPRANNYGVKSNMPGDAPSKIVNMVDLKAVRHKLAASGGVVKFCRCYKSTTFPFCDGSHDKHNKETGDNAGPLVIKGQKKEDGGGAGLQASVKAHEEELLKGLKEVPLSEVAKHNTDGDMWIVVHGRVVDVSKFVEEHPGGVDILKQFKGKVADDKFDSFHTPNIVDENIDKLAIVGRLPASEMGGSTKQEVARPPINDCLNLYDIEKVARYVMSEESFHYYWTGSTDEQTKLGNQLIYRRIRLAPRVMVDVSGTTISTTLLGTRTAMPVYVSGAAKAGLAHKEAEVGLAKGCFKQGVIQMAPHLATKPLKDIAAARSPGQTQWLQLYVEMDRKASEKTIREAEQLGYKAIFITVDAPSVGKRETDLRSTPGGSAPRSNEATKRRWANNLTWHDIEWYRSITKLPVILKGVQRGSDAVRAYKAGVEGIVVSNHGGRNLDTARPALEALVEVIDALKEAKCDRSKFAVFVDGGIYRGSDVYKALALGADAVGIGRAALFGLAAYGQQGVEHVLGILKHELQIAMEFMGDTSIATITGEGLVGVKEAITATAWDRLDRAHLTTVQLPK